MSFISVFNDVLGPVMRGPSSSHNAGAYRIAVIARSLLGEEPRSVSIAFDPDGSYAPTYRVCGVDLAFACGFLAIPMTDERFHDALSLASECGLDLRFDVGPLERADHPNYLELEMLGESGSRLRLAAKSVGGGAIVLSSLGNWPVHLTGKSYDLLAQCRDAAETGATALFEGDGACEGLTVAREAGRCLIHVRRNAPLPPPVRAEVESVPGVERVWRVDPVFFVRRGEALFASAEEMVRWAEANDLSLGRAALEYECRLLGLSEREAMAEMASRFEVMRRSVAEGLAGDEVRMQFLQPTAKQIMEAESRGGVALGGIHTRAAARAMAVMHVSNSGGVVCAAPTGGSAGTLPGVLSTLVAERELSPEGVALALFAASAVGLIVATRATFAAETAGCQVEIGAAGAMAAAAVVEAAGGTARQAVDAAAIAFHNCMGLVCDPVQGACEIPCHTRNAVAASSAFVCADLVMGGYQNPIPLDETIDAVRAVGEMLPRELRCTALGGIAVAPSARALSSSR